MQQPNGNPSFPSSSEGLDLEASPPVFDVSHLLAPSVENTKRRFESCALVIYNLGRPLLETAISTWIDVEIVAKGGMVEGMWALGRGYTALLLNDQLNRDRILLEGPWLIGGAFVYITPWLPGFNVLEANSNFCPIIVDFLNVPMELRPYVRELAGVLGQVVHVYDGGMFSRRPAVKTVVVYDLAKPIFNKITYKIGSAFYTLNVNFLNVPGKCNYCKGAGHVMRECPSMAPPPTLAPVIPPTPLVKETQVLPTDGNVLPNNGKGILHTPLVIEEVLPRTPLKHAERSSLVDEEGFQRVERRRNLFKAQPRGRPPHPFRNFVPRGGYARGPNLARGAMVSREGKSTMNVDHPPPIPPSQGPSLPPRRPSKEPLHANEELAPLKDAFKDILAKGLASRINRIREEDLEVVSSSQVLPQVETGGEKDFGPMWFILA